MRLTWNGPLILVTCEADVDALASANAAASANEMAWHALTQAKPNSGELVLGRINVNRLSPTHFALLEIKCVDTRFDFLAIAETFLHPNMDDSHLSIDGFNFYRADRREMDGGGVGIYVLDDFAVKTLAASKTTFENKPEYLILQITTVIHSNF